jgi:hypothetical protein
VGWLGVFFFVFSSNRFLSSFFLLHFYNFLPLYIILVRLLVALFVVLLLLLFLFLFLLLLLLLLFLFLFFLLL